MPSTPHDARERARAQARYTAATTAVPTLKAAGVHSAAAAEAATAADLQLAITKEAGTPLS